MRTQHLAFLSLASILVFSACASATPATSETGSESTSVLATSVEDIVGSWSPLPGELYYEFNGDGTYATGNVVGNGNRVPGVKGTLQFDGTRVTLLETENNGDRLFQPCGDTPGIYEVQLLAGDALQFIKIEDECVGRYATLSIPLDKLP